MIRTLKAWLSVAALSLVAACGGGGGSAGDPVLGGGGGSGTTVKASDLVIQLSSASLTNDASSTVTATVTALDASRNALPGAAVAITADNGAVVTLVPSGSSTTLPTVTDTAGQMTAKVGIGSDATLRTITVTATSGSVSKTASFAVVATPGATVPAAIEIIASGTTVGTGGDEVTLTAFVKDSKNNAMPAMPIAFSTDTGTLTDVSSATNTSGVAKATFSAGGDKSNRTATISVTSGAIQSTYTLPIVGTRLTFSGATTLTLGASTALTLAAIDSKGNSLPNVSIAVASSLGNGLSSTGVTTNANGQASVTYTATRAGADSLSFTGGGATVGSTMTVSGEDFAFVSVTSAAPTVGVAYPLQVRFLRGGLPQAGVTVRFAATVGDLSAPQVTTNASGIANVALTSAFAAPSTISATAVDGSGSTIAVATSSANFVATTPATLVLQVSPSALAPNPAGGTDSQTTVVAKVTDANGNPVPGITVNFSQYADPSGGRLLQASTPTDSNGEATVKYVAGATTTANNGVELRAAVASNTAVSGRVNLTVNQSALFIVLGTGNTISNADPDTYEKTWTAVVTDANGVRVSGVTLTVKVIPAWYGKGELRWDEPNTRWRYYVPGTGSYQDTVPWICPNEDSLSSTASNRENGRLDPGEDVNQDGQLTPGNVVALASSTVTTDGDGRASIVLRYPESYASWIGVRLTATGIVAGTESSSYREFALDHLASDYATKTIAPAGAVSPFGTVLGVCNTTN